MPEPRCRHSPPCPSPAACAVRRAAMAGLYTRDMPCRHEPPCKDLREHQARQQCEICQARAARAAFLRRRRPRRAAGVTGVRIPPPGGAP
jgi:hypothetical protein